MSPAEKRRAWAQQLIDRAGDRPPAYGSPEFLALPDGPAKVAAVVIAAECWAREGDDLPERLRLEVDLARSASKATEDAEYVARRDQWHQEWGDKSYRPHPANRRCA